MEVLKFFSWMSRHLHPATQEQEKEQVPDLPDDIIMDILSRLSADLVLKHRVVCKRWLYLTSSPYFARLHRKRASPSLLIQTEDLASKVLELFMFDEDKEGSIVAAKRIRDSVRVGPPEEKLRIMGTYDGVLILEHVSNPGSRLELFNLVTRQRLCIETPPGTHDMSLTPHAMFLHGSGDLRLLFINEVVGQLPQESTYFDYYIYSLKDKLSWRKVVSRSPYYPVIKTDPVSLVLANTPTLFWMTRSIQLNGLRTAPCQSTIIMFDTVAETVRAMPHPVDTTPSLCLWPEDKVMCVYECERVLHFCSVVSLMVGIWVLEDFDNWNWTKKKAIYLRSSSSSSYWFWPWWPSRSSRDSSLRDGFDLMGVVKVGDGKLVLYTPNSLLLLDLKTNKIVLTFEQDNMDQSGLQLDGVISEVFFYTKSFMF